MLDTLTKTSTLLLAGLQDPTNQAVWIEFDQRYRPILFGMVRKQGLSHADTEDIVQQTLAVFSRDYLAGRYNRQRGQLRSWLFGIVRHRIIDQQRSAAKRLEHEGGTAIMRMPDESELLESWNTQKASAILQLALSQLRSEGAYSDRTLDAFEGVGLSGRSCKDVAETLDMDVEDVYAAKYRVGKALKNIVTKIETAYDI